jgi:hypothetical protein
MKHNIALLLVFFLLAGCATGHSPQEKRALLLQHTAWWNNLRLSGILEANYQGFQFRKDAVLDCTPAALTLTVVDAGLFGMSPQPFLVATLTPEACSITTGGTTENIPAEQLAQMLPDLQFLLHPQQMLEHEDAILHNGQFHTSSAMYHFDTQLRITRIQAKIEPLTIDFDWGESLQKITVLRDGKVLASLKIDTITRQ